MRPRRFIVPDSIVGALAALPPEIKRKVRAGMDGIRQDPGSGKELVEDLSGLRSFRVGRFRIVYRCLDDGNVEIAAVGPRETIYAEAARLRRRGG